MKYTMDIDNNIYDDNQKMTVEDIVFTLNDLYEQNKELKEQRKQLIQGIQEEAKISAEAFTKALFKEEDIDFTWQTNKYKKP